MKTIQEAPALDTEMEITPVGDITTSTTKAMPIVNPEAIAAMDKEYAASLVDLSPAQPVENVDVSSQTKDVSSAENVPLDINRVPFDKEKMTGKKWTTGENKGQWVMNKSGRGYRHYPIASALPSTTPNSTTSGQPLKGTNAEIKAAEVNQLEKAIVHQHKANAAISEREKLVATAAEITMLAELIGQGIAGAEGKMGMLGPDLSMREEFTSVNIAMCEKYGLKEPPVEIRFMLIGGMYGAQIYRAQQSASFFGQLSSKFNGFKSWLGSMFSSSKKADKKERKPIHIEVDDA